MKDTTIQEAIKAAHTAIEKGAIPAYVMLGRAFDRVASREDAERLDALHIIRLLVCEYRQIQARAGGVREEQQNNE